ncbi:hypothetical protein [Burkholderia plantarii]|uniref:hypothetical protein n=1 Tax=Burkholderia plantarii TaxID=41899 RepID=UPI000AB560C6|nr:hypothetical protein [Burkholderia plantarii]
MRRCPCLVSAGSAPRAGDFAAGRNARTLILGREKSNDEQKKRGPKLQQDVSASRLSQLVKRAQLFLDFFLIVWVRVETDEEFRMDINWIASGAVLLVMVMLSAYRDALKNEPISRFGFDDGNALAEELE